MWSLEIINYRNQAHAAGLTATEVNFLAPNKIYPIVGYKIDEESLEKIQKFKEDNAHGK